MSDERTNKKYESLDSMADHHIVEFFTRGAQKIINFASILYALLPIEMPLSTRIIAAFGIPLVVSLSADSIVDSSREVLINDLE